MKQLVKESEVIEKIGDLMLNRVSSYICHELQTLRPIIFFYSPLAFGFYFMYLCKDNFLKEQNSAIMEGRR